MRFSTQPNEIEEKREAFAPYNFVPLPEKVVEQKTEDLPDQGKYQSGLMSGYLDCELTTESPIYIRAGLNQDQANNGKESKSIPNFFYLNDENQPVIPGSSLRGMIRTLVEIVTYSRVNFVSDKRMIYRSVGGATNHDALYRDKLMQYDGDRDRKKFYTPKIVGGYMVKKGNRDWAIRPAKLVDGTTYAHLRVDEKLFKTFSPVENTKNAFRVFIRTSPFDYQDVRGGFLKIKYAKVLEAKSSPATGLRAGTLAISGPMYGKLSEAVVYEPDMDDSKLLFLTDEQVDDYREQISKEQIKLLGDRGGLSDGQPVFYTINEKTKKVDFFGHPRMFRVPYPNSPFDYIPDEIRGSSTPKHPDLVDFAEAMFGFTREIKKRQGSSKQRAYAGRIHISDARLLPRQNEIWLSPDKTITPKILSEPKPTTFQHYLVQTEPNNYKIGETRDGKTKYETRLRDYASPIGETVIRGHKFYWHKGAASLNDIQEKGEVKKDDSVHTRINPLRPDVRFFFRVSFENLSQEELGALLFVLDIIASSENTRLKIGMGKPLGMGAVKITSKLYVKDIVTRYSSLFKANSWNSGVISNNNAAQTALSAFLDRMKAELGVELIKTKRISALLTLLQWPGIKPDQDGKPTRYMKIEHPDPKAPRGKVNEYRDRPVLPTPFGVWSKNKK